MDYEMDKLLRLLAVLLALTLVSLAMPGCPGDDDDDDDNDDSATADDDVADDDVADDDAADDDAGDDDTAPANASVIGAASREFQTCPPAGDGVGDLCVYLLATCEDLPSEVASVVVPDADLSWPDNRVDFTITGVADGLWQGWGFLDDDGSGCDGGPTSGDFFLSGGCVEVEVAGQQDVTGVQIVFNDKY